VILRELDRLKIDNALLLVVDVQGKLARLVHESDSLIRQAGSLIVGCRALDVPVIWAEQVPDKLGVTVPELAEKLAGLRPMVKYSFGCCEDDQIDRAIRENRRSQVILCGIEAHVCVWQTAVSLLIQGYRVHLICDAVSSRTALNRDLGIQRIAGAGGLLSSVEMALFELMGSARHPKFREVAKLFR
jgi:nicotinamidase-related amidase